MLVAMSQRYMSTMWSSQVCTVKIQGDIAYVVLSGIKAGDPSHHISNGLDVNATWFVFVLN